MVLYLVSTFYFWVLCNQLFHQPLFLYFCTLGIEIWFRQEKCSFVEKNSFASFAILFEISRKHRERLCQKFNIVRFLPSSAQRFNGYVEASSILKIADMFPLTFLQLVNSSKNKIVMNLHVLLLFFVFETTLKDFPLYSPLILTLSFRYLQIRVRES